MTNEDYAWEPPAAGTEAEQVIGALNRLRMTFRWKTDDLDAAGLRARIGASVLTLGGLRKHLAAVEDYTFPTNLPGDPIGLPWDATGWDGSTLTQPCLGVFTKGRQSSYICRSTRKRKGRKGRTMSLTWPLEQQGSIGENVRSIQYLLNARVPATSGTTTSEGAPGPADETSQAAVETSAPTTVTEAPPSEATELLDVDGIFGRKTDAAVRAFQAQHGLTVDGKVGNQTWPVLIIQVSTGSTGDAVQAVQSQLHARSGWLTIDGTFGLQTDGVVRSFQGFCQFSVDGIVGPNTWNALTLPWLRASSGRSAAELVFQAWSNNDRAAARYEAIPAAVDMLFARTYEAGWTFGGCQGTAGSFVCTWQRTGDKLILEGNDSTGTPFYYVNNVTSEI